MVKKNAPEKKPSAEAIIEEPQPKTKGVIAAMLPLLAGVVVMVSSAWAFTKFFLLEQITNKLEAAGLVLEDPSEEKTEKAKPKPEKKPLDGKAEDRDVLINLLAAGIAEKDLPATQNKEWEKKKKENFDAFATKQFNQPIKVAEVNRYLIATFVIGSSQSRAHREMLKRILTDKKSFINDEAISLIAGLSSFKDMEEVSAKTLFIKTQLSNIIKTYVSKYLSEENLTLNEDLVFTVLAEEWTVQ